jgi:hypothetical protein
MSYNLCTPVRKLTLQKNIVFLALFCIFLRKEKELLKHDPEQMQNGLKAKEMNRNQ